MDIDDDEIDDLEDIRKIMQETQGGNTQTNISAYTEPTITSEIVPFNPDALEKNTVLQRPAIDTTFRQPTNMPSFSSTRPVPHYQQSSQSNTGSFTTDISGRPFTSTTSLFSTSYHQLNLNNQQQNEQRNGNQHTFSTPSSSSMPESLFNSQTRNRPTTFGTNTAQNPSFSSSSNSSTIAGRSEQPTFGASAYSFNKKTSSSSSDFKSLSRNSNSYYNRQPTSVFSSNESNTNSDYRFKPVDLPTFQFSKPYFPDDAEKQKQAEKASFVSPQFPPNTQPDNNHEIFNDTTNSIAPIMDSPSDIDEQNPTLLRLKEGPPRPKTRPDSRPMARPHTHSHIKHMSDEIRRSNEQNNHTERTYNNGSNKERDHLLKPDHRDNLTGDTTSTNDRQLTYSPVPPISTPRIKSPISRFNLSSGINPKMDARPLGLQVKASTHSAATNKMDKTGKIPRKTALVKQKDDIHSMKLLDLLSKKKEIMDSLCKLEETRKSLERKKSDLERNSRGSSFYENDPQHRYLKEQLTTLSVNERELKATLDSIWDKLENQYNHKRTSISTDRLTSRSELTKKSRPKMSTTPAGPTIDVPNRLEREQQLLNSQLNLDDGNNWCQVCDVHLKSLKEYCGHIHSESHTEKTKNKSRPWSKGTNEFLTKGETLEVIEKVIRAEASRRESNLSLEEFNAIFDASKYKSTKKQDKPETSENAETTSETVDKTIVDIYRGHRFLIPTVGYYCQLCDRGLFDDSDVENHMRSYEHIVAHTRMVFIDPHIESNYHRDMNRSLEKLKANKNNNRSRYEENLKGLIEAKERKENEKRRRVIEDEPRRLQEKSRLPSPKSRKRANIEARDSNESSEADSPIKKKQTTSRNKVTNATRKLLSRELELSDDSDNETSIISQSIMKHNDPDSPFPGLEIEVHGNTHTALLKDKRLRQQNFVEMEKLDITNPIYARLLSSENDLSRLDSSASLFNTIVKAEPFDWTLAQPTYFDKCGDLIAITLDSDNEDNDQYQDIFVKKEKPDKPSDKMKSEKNPIHVKQEKPASTKGAEPEVIKLFSDDEEESDSKMIDIDSNLLSACTDTEEINDPLPNFTSSSTLTSKSMEFTSTIPERKPNETLNSMLINNDSSNDNLGGLIFDTKSECSSPVTRASSPPLDNIIISNHSQNSNLISTTLGDTSLEDQSIDNQLSTDINPATTSLETAHSTDSLTTSTASNMDCAQNSLNFSHESDFQTPTFSDLSDPLVNTFTGDSHLNSL